MISVQALANGVIISKNFIIPDTPPIPTCINGYDSINLAKPLVTNTFIEGFFIESEAQSNGTGNGLISQTIPHNNKIILTNLKPATLYTIQMSYKIINGKSTTSEMAYCQTLPASEPANLRVDLATQSSLTLKWHAPARYLRIISLMSGAVGECFWDLAIFQLLIWES